MIKLNKKEVLEIRTKELDLLKRNEIITTIILTIMIIAILVFVVISDNKAEEVVADNTENIENLIVNIQEDEKEYIDINELEESIIDEEKNTIDKNIDKNNNVISNQTPSKDEGKPYYIKVNYKAQVVTIYKKDSQGNYTNAIKAMVCSTGEYTPTSGVYKIKERWKWLGLEGDVYGQYATQIVGNILFHSVPYLERGNKGSLKYLEYDKLGTYASAGCVRLTVADALWIYNNCERGTLVEFYSSSNPGPLGKPVAKKISNAKGDFKNWDPTDPDTNNPWKNYKPEENTNTDKNNINANTENNNEITNNQITNNEIVNNEKQNEIKNEVNNTTIELNEIIDITYNNTNTNTQINENQTD